VAVFFPPRMTENRDSSSSGCTPRRSTTSPTRRWPGPVEPGDTVATESELYRFGLAGFGDSRVRGGRLIGGAGCAALIPARLTGIVSGSTPLGRQTQQVLLVASDRALRNHEFTIRRSGD
jgi:hypothetical protein